LLRSAVQTADARPTSRKSWALSHFRAKAVARNREVVRLHLHPDDNLDLTNQLKTAEVLFSDSAIWAARVREFAVKEKLPQNGPLIGRSGNCSRGSLKPPLWIKTASRPVKRILQ
jgi:hypothetical protein